MRRTEKWGLLVAALCGAIFMTSTAQATWTKGTTIETMSASDASSIGSWDSLDVVAGSVNNTAVVNNPPYPDAVRFLAGQININESCIGGAVHLQMNNVPTDAGVRLDATTFQGVFASNLQNWGVGVHMVWDADNFISLQHIRDNGGGWKVFQSVAGTSSNDHIDPGYMDNQWLMSGIDISETEIKFYASPRGVDQYGVTDYDGQMAQIGSTLARPASFAGGAAMIVGKGWHSGAGDPWDGQWDLVGPKVFAIDDTRLTVVPEPASLALILAGGLVAFAARRRS